MNIPTRRVGTRTISVIAQALLDRADRVFNFIQTALTEERTIQFEEGTVARRQGLSPA
jgi:hypothetical protein